MQFNYLPFLFGCLLTTGALAQTCKPESMPATTPTSQFTDHGDGTVTDTRTGLTWKRCSEGQSWSGGTCTGSVSFLTWANALQRAASVNAGQVGEALGHGDWRVPNFKELASIVEEQCYSPAINLTVFPAAPSDYFWSSSPVASNGGGAWVVDFYGGSSVWDGKGNYALRLVRGGQ